MGKIFPIVEDDVRKIPYALDGVGVVGKKINLGITTLHTCKAKEFFDTIGDSLKKHFDYNLAIVAIIKNEAPYIREWIEYHKLVGVDKFYIYDNESTDNVKDVLEPYIKQNVVSYFYISGKGKQVIAYQDAIKKFKYTVKYMAFIDLDEFLLPMHEDNVFSIIEDLFAHNNQAGGIAVQWCVFGSANHIRKPDGLVIENYLYRAEGHFESRRHSNRHIKTICNPRRVLLYGQCHYPKYYKSWHNINTDNEKIDGPFCETICWDKLRINHYFTKSFEEYLAKKKRGRASTRGLCWGVEDFFETDVNDVYDDSILRFVPALKKALDE